MDMAEKILYLEITATLVGALVAVVLTCVLFRAFPKSNAPKNTNPPAEIGDDKELENSGHLPEGVRLAELRIKELDDAVMTVEKKAVQLIILCVALLGYLASNRLELHLYALLKILAFASLFVSGVYGFMTTDLGKHKSAGLSPVRFLYAIEKDGYEKMLVILMGTYQKAIEQKLETQEGKAERLRRAKPWIIFGVACLMGWLVADNLFAYLSPER